MAESFISLKSILYEKVWVNPTTLHKSKVIKAPNSVPFVTLFKDFASI
ncbi:hypothetical protein THF1C08_10074 [Vibrio jasicida]|uniref:Uncharacterized protein n=1 Tax=Vibrio jasicida TaxID=766224 RepID=A0AAU9QED2_9VIBR|nr:hypothetical protein THF1C08_10074 [Vibrio jasicida]CAH1562503.1 hypothetical protein THF1A12_10073 [Vibrio jasicida]